MLKGVNINREPKNNWECWGSTPLGREAWLTPRNTSLPMCDLAELGWSALKCTSTENNPQNWGALELCPLGMRSIADP